jgi:hypothetical protein
MGSVVPANRPSPPSVLELALPVSFPGHGVWSSPFSHCPELVSCRWPQENLSHTLDHGTVVSRDGSFAHGRGYPQIPDPTGASVGRKIRLWARIRAQKSACEQLMGSDSHPRVFPLPVTTIKK